MPSEHIAEWILSLLQPKDRAVATVGDLIEDAGERRTPWFWLHVTRIAVTLLWRNLGTAPLRMIGFAIFGWFAYMAASLVLVFAGFILASLNWGMGYFLAHHTGPELLANALRFRFDWPPPPPGMMHATQLLVICIVAPFEIGRFTALYWRGREVAAWVIVSLVWPFMAVSIPFVVTSTRVTLPLMPLIQVFVLLGVLTQCHVSRQAQ